MDLLHVSNGRFLSEWLRRDPLEGFLLATDCRPRTECWRVHHSTLRLVC